MCAGYLKFLCLPPEFASKLDNIYLTLLFESRERKEFGNMAVFRPLLRELMELEDKPLMMTTTGYLIFVRCFVFHGDNLGIHETLGFVESFVANFPCRMCKIVKEDLKIASEENPLLMRTVENYEADCAIDCVSETGINSKCIFNELNNYHCITNASSDVMHDIDEGVSRYIMSFLILEFCKKNTSI
ncbi:hypothetical protein TKK_0014321 [Trichogramma kaykai]|uniref:Uncharacterized protein n=1 Tax=Trichogramma kaykai TaxID=54128 RepID=A0ABD2WDX3_9HYME